MPTVRKRSLRELSSDDTPTPAQPSMLHRIRNMWQFANLYQFILLFGQALKINDNLDIEDLEAECLRPGSMVLQDIGLGLLKFLSSHRGLTHELFDEYTRRQFLSKAPEKNPFGTEENPAKFAHFDVFAKIRVLQQMTQLIWMTPERLRERTEEQKDTDQTSWRIEPYGWDRHDRTYYVLDDNRLYRLTDAPPPIPKSKKNTKKARAAQRSSKRRRVSSGVASDADDANGEASDAAVSAEPEDDGLGGMKWECLAVTLDEVRDFLSTIQKSKDANEKTLRDQIQEHLVPILEKQEESKKRKQLQREKELLNLEKLANAKRSSRLASKLEQQRLEERAREEERKRREEEAARQKEEQQRLKMERERDNRLMSREQRLKEREARRRLHEEELAQLSEDSRGARGTSARMSERRRLAEIERNKKALQELQEQEDDWVFDCVCGAYGQVDDGTHSVACERCNTWQHSKCLGIDEQEADRDDFHFICSSCRRREDTPNGPNRRMIKIKVNRPEETPSPVSKADEQAAATAQQPQGQLVVEFQTAQSSGLRDAAAPLRPAPQNETHATLKERPGEKGIIGSRHVQQPSSTPGNNPFSSPHPSLFPVEPQSLQSGARDPGPGVFNLPRGDGGRTSRLASEAAASTGAPSTLAGSGSGGVSPSKQPHRPAPAQTKTSTSAPVLSKESALAENNNTMTPSQPLGLPHLAPMQSHDARSDHAVSETSPLPPPSAGLSPTKHSPPVTRIQPQVTGNANGAAHPPVGGVHLSSVAVFPPVAALSPSPQQQILTPPIKPAEPARAPPQQLPQGVQTPKLVPSGSPRLGPE